MDSTSAGSERRTFFFTVVTAARRPLFADAALRNVLGRAVRNVRERYPFDVDAWVLLPDHLHCVWTLPPGDDDASSRWTLIKRTFSREVAKAGLAPRPAGGPRRGAPLWARGFRMRAIAGEDDLRAHVDRLHLDPVRHGLVASVADWPQSTFHRYRRLGRYPEDWGNASATGAEHAGPPQSSAPPGAVAGPGAPPERPSV